MTIGASDGLSPLAQTLCDSRIEKRQSTPCQDPNAPSDPIRGEFVDWVPKLWAAIAAVEIDRLGEAAGAVVDSLLVVRLDQLGGTRALRLYGSTAGVLSPLERRAWLLGELEVRALFFERLEDDKEIVHADVVARARRKADRSARAMLERAEAAELKVAELLDRLDDERQRALTAERRRANAEAVASEQARVLREVGRVAAAWAPPPAPSHFDSLADAEEGKCVDATNTGDES